MANGGDLPETNALYFNHPATGVWAVRYVYDNFIGGWRITEVVTGGQGDVAGFQPGDVVMQVGLARADGTRTLDVMVNSAIASNNRFFIVRDRNTGQNVTANF